MPPDIGVQNRKVIATDKVCVYSCYLSFVYVSNTYKDRFLLISLEDNFRIKLSVS